jgi:dUTP pyrophosphatase
MIQVKFTKTHPDATLPTVNNSDYRTGDSGYDLYSVDDVVIPGNSNATVPVGITLADITEGYWFRIEPRSGLGFKHGIQPHLGVIDNGYRGDLAVKLYNFHENDHHVTKHDKIAQIVFYPLVQAEVSFSDCVSETKRGDKGFGSSDTTTDNSTTYTDTYNHV